MKKFVIFVCLLVLALISLSAVSSVELDADKFTNVSDDDQNAVANLFGIVFIKTLYHGQPQSFVDVTMYRHKDHSFVGNMKSIDGTAVIKGKICGRYDIVAKYPTGEVVNGYCGWNQDKVVLNVN